MIIKAASNIKQGNDLEIDLSRCIFIGQGRCGKVYLMPDGRVIKIFKDEESCVQEYIILESVKGNKHFPRAYECRNNWMIRDYVDGVCLDEYIKRNGLNKNISQNLVELIQDFKMLGFTRLDMRCSHIFVQIDESIMVIAPREHYSQKVPYPKKMLGKLRKLHLANKFMGNIKVLYPSLYDEWKNPGT